MIRSLSTSTESKCLARRSIRTRLYTALEQNYLAVASLPPCFHAPSSNASRSGSRPGTNDHTPASAIRFSYGDGDFGEPLVHELLRKLPIQVAQLHLAQPAGPVVSVCGQADEVFLLDRPAAQLLGRAQRGQVPRIDVAPDGVRTRALTGQE